MKDEIRKRRQILAKIERSIELEKGREVFDINQYTRYCLRGDFLDDDGAAYWSDKEEGKGRRQRIYPSRIVRGAQPPSWATCVVWFPK